MEGISFVVPVHNGAAWIRETLQAILRQADGRPMEIIVVDDRSRDRSSELLEELALLWPLRIVAGDGRGAAAAINTGLREARFSIVCQVDQDVVIQPGWMQRLVACFDDPSVGAAQGYYTRDPEAALCARAMSMDLEQRYAAIEGPETDQVCTGNSAYRVEALRQVGLFDETFGYGYDNDMSYRLRAAGYRLIFCREARSLHRWREGLTGYISQQYGFGYGRIDLVVKHPGRWRGDQVSPATMMLHPILMSLALAGFAGALAIGLAGGAWGPLALVAGALVAGLSLERCVAGVKAAHQFRDPAPLVFPILHLGRDLAWVTAIAMWSLRWLAGHPAHPTHSMRPRPSGRARGYPTAPDRGMAWPAALRLSALIPVPNDVAGETGEHGGNGATRRSGETERRLRRS